MNIAMTRAFNLLNLTPEQQQAFFSWLEMAGYMDVAPVKKAFLYLHTFSHFETEEKIDTETLLARFQSMIDTFPRDENGSIDMVNFIDEFGKACHFTPSDYVDLFVFLSQIAFDREYGKERSDLKSMTWMRDERNQATFFNILKALGMYDGRQLTRPSVYLGVGVMGASYGRLQRRLAIFERTLPYISSMTKALVLSGKRELTTALDTPDAMRAVAIFLGREPQLITKVLNGQTRECIAGEPAVNESDLAAFLIHTRKLEGQLALVDGQIAKGHWRTTTTENAKDLTNHIFAWLKTQANLEGKEFEVLIAVEQPYLSRMCLQVQRAIDEKCKEANLPCTIKVTGVGDGLEEVWAAVSDKTNMVVEAHSEMACLFSERYNDARLSPDYISRRDPAQLMFATREKAFSAVVQGLETARVNSDREQVMTLTASRHKFNYSGADNTARLEQLEDGAAAKPPVAS